MRVEDEMREEAGFDGASSEVTEWIEAAVEDCRSGDPTDRDPADPNDGLE